MEAAEYAKMDRLESVHPWFAAKRKFLAYYLDRYLLPPAKVLDIGCGTGAIMEELGRLGYDIFGIDPSAEALNYCCQKSLAVAAATAEKTEQPDSSFDGVIALDVLEHLPDDQAGLREMLRILKPGGTAIITVPAHQDLFSVHDKELHHFRRYGRAQLCELFSDDWQVVDVAWLHASILLPVALKRRMLKILKRETRASDVKEVGGPASCIVNFLYWCEVKYLRLFGRLPWGLSLVAVLKKKI